MAVGAVPGPLWLLQYKASQESLCAMASNWVRCLRALMADHYCRLLGSSHWWWPIESIPRVFCPGDTRRESNVSLKTRQDKMWSDRLISVLDTRRPCFTLQETDGMLIFPLVLLDWPFKPIIDWFDDIGKEMTTDDQIGLWRWAGLSLSVIYLSKVTLDALSSSIWFL